MPYQEMSDRELMIKLYTRVDNLCDDVAELKQSFKERSCPGPLCREHETMIEEHHGRLLTLETYFKIIGGTVVIVLTAVIGLIVDKVM